MVSAVVETARALQDKPAVAAIAMLRRDLAKALSQSGGAWQQAIAEGVRRLALQGASPRARAICHHPAAPPPVCPWCKFFSDWFAEIGAF